MYLTTVKIEACYGQKLKDIRRWLEENVGPYYDGWRYYSTNKARDVVFEIDDEKHATLFMLRWT